jgi:hypothetical protein
MIDEHIENIERSFNTVVKLHGIADALKVEYVNDMSASTGYDVAPDVKVARNEKGDVVGVMTADGTFYNVKVALQKNYLTVVRVEPSQELTDAIAAVNQAQKAFRELTDSMINPYNVTIGTKKTRTGTGSSDGTVRASDAKKADVKSAILKIDPAASVEFDDGRRFTVTLSNGTIKSYDIFGQSFLMSIAGMV